MSHETSGEFSPVFLSARNFLDEELALAGVDSVAKLRPGALAAIATRFQDAQSIEDEANIAQLDLDEETRECVFELLSARGITMRTMLELMIGFNGRWEDLE